MSNHTPPQRCRLILIAPPDEDADTFGPRLMAAAAGGDIASLILPARPNEAEFQAFATPIVRIAQEAGIAAIVADDMRIAARTGADGVHMQTGFDDLCEAIEKTRGKMIVGAGGAVTRDEALKLGEAQPDYLFFGRIDYDKNPEAHRRNLTLGAWWAEVVEIPCIVLGGSEISSVTAVASTGVEFVALSRAVFGEGVDPREAVAQVNALLDRTAHYFGD